MQLTLRKAKPLVWVYLAVAAVLSLGVVPVLLGVLWGVAWLLDSRPAALDREGLTTRRGRRLLWKDLVEAQPQTEYRRVAARIVPVRHFMKLVFKDARVAFEPDLYEQGDEALAFLKRCLRPDPRVELLLGVLRDARAFVAQPDGDYTWSSWVDQADALRELDRHILAVSEGRESGAKFSILFAPTGPMQELAISSGWGDAFNDLADRYDDAMALDG